MSHNNPDVVNTKQSPEQVLSPFQLEFEINCKQLTKICLISWVLELTELEFLGILNLDLSCFRVENALAQLQRELTQRYSGVGADLEARCRGYVEFAGSECLARVESLAAELQELVV